MRRIWNKSREMTLMLSNRWKFWRRGKVSRRKNTQSRHKMGTSWVFTEFQERLESKVVESHRYWRCMECLWTWWSGYTTDRKLPQHLYLLVLATMFGLETTGVTDSVKATNSSIQTQKSTGNSSGRSLGPRICLLSLTSFFKRLAIRKSPTSDTPRAPLTYWLPAL